MKKVCSCGNGCPLCDVCDEPICECYCEFDFQDERGDDTDEPW